MTLTTQKRGDRAMKQKQGFPAVCVGLVLVVGVVCGCKDSRSGATPEHAVAAPTVDPATAGSITVTVRFRGTPPEPKPVVMRGAPQCVQLHSEPVYDESLAVDADGRLLHAVVWVDDGLPAVWFPPPATPTVIDQKGCLYQPRVAVATVGQGVEFRNSDPEPHNVHTQPQTGRGTNFMLTRAGTSRTVKFDKPEVAVRVGCDVHPWMVAYVAVLAHPYGAVTRRGEDVTLGPLPPGRYSVAVWHEKLGVQKQVVQLDPRGRAMIEFSFQGP